MGFVLDTVHKLVFEEFFDADSGEFLEIRCTPLTFQEYVLLTSGEMSRDAHAEMFTAHLLSWNLQNRLPDGDVVDVAATPEGARSQDTAFLLRLMTEWAGQLGSVRGPLGGRSTGGPQSEEASIPMETPSGSPESSNMPS